MIKIINREDILAARNFGIKEIEIPEWNGCVLIRKWSGKDRSKFLQASVKIDENNVGVNYDTIFENQMLVVALSLCDENGKRLFTNSPEDIAAIGEIDSGALQVIYEEALMLNALKTTSLTDAAKNSEPVQSENSISV